MYQKNFMISDTTFFLADEPTGNLDSKNGKKVMEMLSELHKEGTTIVMATQSLHDANYVYVSSSMKWMIASGWACCYQWSSVSRLHQGSSLLM